MVLDNEKQRIMIKELINAMEFTGNVKQLKTVLADVNELADAVDAAEITTLNTVNIKLAE
jgi:arginase family enzyme